jgi:hypothetical protein
LSSLLDTTEHPFQNQPFHQPIHAPTFKIDRLLRRLERRELRAESKIKHTANKALLIRRRDRFQHRLKRIFGRY